MTAMRKSEPGNRKENLKINAKRYDFRRRTKDVALRTIRLVGALPKKQAAFVIGNQLLRSAMSVGANHRAAKRARSEAEFAAKMGIVEEELDECLYWMELLVESGMVPEERLRPLMQEVNEPLAITVASIRTTKAKGQKRPRGR
jgi:four helix bundle protein